MADFDDGGKRSRTPYLSAEERYNRDPAFHTIVDMMVCAMLCALLVGLIL